MSETTEVAVKHPANELERRMQYATTLAASDLLPAAYRRKPQNVLLAMEYGNALGLDTVTAIQQVHVIEGKPTASAQLIGTLVRRAGHRLRVIGDGKHAIAEIVRSDDPDFTFKAEWTITRAAAAGLTGKGPWKQYPEAMLKARAITEVARDACPEALAGVAYTAEEITDGNHEAATWAIDEPDTIEAEVVEDLATDPQPAPEQPAGSPATPAQIKAIGAMLRKCGVGTTEQRHAIVDMIAGRKVESTSDLTKQDAHAVIEIIKPFADSEAPEAALTDWLNG
jgi:hypothetical protein